MTASIDRGIAPPLSDLFSVFSSALPSHDDIENSSTALGLAYTPPGISSSVACRSPEVVGKSHAPRKADCGHVPAAETSLKSAQHVDFPTTGSHSRGQVAPFRTTSHYGSALTWSQLPGAPSWIAENSADVSSSGQLRRVPQGAGKSVRGPRDPKYEY